MLRLWLTPAASVAILVATAAAFQPRSDPDTRAACLVDIMDGAVRGAGTHGVHIGPEYREHLIPSKGTPPVIDGEIAEEGESFRLGQDGMQFGSVRADQLDSTQESKLVHADLLPTMGPRRTAMLRGVTGPPRRTNATPNRIRTRPAGSNGMFPHDGVIMAYAIRMGRRPRTVAPGTRGPCSNHNGGSAQGRRVRGCRAGFRQCGRGLRTVGAGTRERPRARCHARGAQNHAGDVAVDRYCETTFVIESFRLFKCSSIPMRGTPLLIQSAAGEEDSVVRESRISS